MKYASKIAFFLLLAAFGSTSFGMMRMLSRKPTPARQYQQLSPQQQKRFIQTKASSTTPQQAAPSLYARFQEAIRNAWTTLIGRPSQAPVITAPQSIALEQPTEQLSVPINRQTEQQDLESALKEVAQNSEKLDLNNQQETNIILCSAPGNEELAWLLKIKSPENMESHFTQQRIKILSPYLTPAEIDEYLAAIKQNRDNVIRNYSQPLPEELRTILDRMIGPTNLSPSIQEPCIQMLIDVGMNPKSLLILDGKSLPKLALYPFRINNTIKKLISSITIALMSIRGSAAGGGTVSIKYGDNKEHAVSLLCFIKEKLIEGKNLTNFIIAHEIGHLLRDHANEENMIKETLENLPTERYIQKNKPEIQYINKLISKSIINQIKKELHALYELEADATAAIINPDIAKKLYIELSEQVKPATLFKKLLYLSSEPHKQKESPIHSSSWDKFHLIKTIKELHEKNDIEPISQVAE